MKKQDQILDPFYLLIEMYSFSEWQWPWQSWSGLTNLLKGKESLKKQKHLAKRKKKKKWPISFECILIKCTSVKHKQHLVWARTWRKKNLNRIHIYCVSSLMGLTLSLADLPWAKYTIRLHQQVQKWSKLILERKPLH